PDFELGEYKRQDLVYEKEDLLISGPGKYPEYNFYRMAGMAIDPRSAARRMAFISARCFAFVDVVTGLAE
ncbi:hypothetical protein MJN76_29645, partial [Salmonella enterica subsp. enterica serovar Anatum]|nr:hypothetical protein [Salmonella enterica subsp. enterica serovar Anatum]